jgi:hypothetical protein
MPTPTERDSIITDLVDRYNKQKVGGAFDAKQAGKVFVDDFNNTFADGFTKGGQNTNFPKKDSMYVQGLSTVKYGDIPKN